MGLFDSWRSKLSQVNESMATAHKSWRDERLGEREQRASNRERDLAEREAKVSLQLAEMRAIEGRRWRRKIGLIFTAIAAAALGFLVGGNLGSTPETSTRNVAAPTPEITPSLSEVDQQESVDEQESLPAMAADRPPTTSTRPHASDPDKAAAEGVYGTGKQFNVGWYCLDVADQGEVTFEQCLGAAALALRSSQSH
jgi:hypothetical protein